MKENCVMEDHLSSQIDDSSLDCIDMCMGEYHSYYASHIIFDSTLFPFSFVSQIEGEISTKVIDNIESIVDPPP